MHEKVKRVQKQLEVRREEETRKQAIREQRKEELKAVKAKKRESAILKSPSQTIAPTASSETEASPVDN